MYKNIAFGFTFLALVLVGVWCQLLQNENGRLTKQSNDRRQEIERLKDQNQKLSEDNERLKRSQAQDAARSSRTVEDLKSDLLQAKKVLQTAQLRLQQATNSGKTESAEDIEPHIHAARQLVQALETKLKDLKSDTQVVDARSSEYRRKRNQDFENRKHQNQIKREELEISLKSLQEQLALARQRPKGPDRNSAIESLNVQINDLREERRVLNVQKQDVESEGKSINAQINSEVQNEKVEVQSERDQVQKELKDAQADLQKWTATKAAGHQTRDQKGKEVQSLADAVKAAQARVSALEQTLRQMDPGNRK